MEHELLIRWRTNGKEYDMVRTDGKIIIEDRSIEEENRQPSFGIVQDVDVWYDRGDRECYAVVHVALDDGKRVRFNTDMDGLPRLMAGFKIKSFRELVCLRVEVVFDERGYVWYLKPWESE